MLDIANQCCCFTRRHVYACLFHVCMHRAEVEVVVSQLRAYAQRNMMLSPEFASATIKKYDSVSFSNLIGSRTMSV